MSCSSRNYHNGLSAEAITEADYLHRGQTLLARRWRGDAGEIDLIFRDGSTLRFVEVKKSRTHARAADRVSARQQARICMAAQEFLGQQDIGMDTDMQFDVALVDGQGQLKILDAAFF